MQRIGLGLAALGRPGYMTLHHGRDLEGHYEPAAMEARAHAVLDAAYAAGVRYIDVARSYGRGEAFLGSWLATHGKGVVVASKWGYTYTGDWRVDAKVPEVKDHSVSTLQRQIIESWGQLGEKLSIYQIHSVTAEGTVLRDQDVLDMLARLRAMGIRIGLTVSGEGQSDAIRRALDVHHDGERLFDVVQATWNLFERGAESALCDAHAAGLHVVVKEALANGRLTEHDRVLAAGERLGVGADAVAMAAVLARPWVDTVLSGAATVPQLESNLRACAIQWDPALEQFLAPLTIPSDEYWAFRRSFVWN
ncbi:MAG TPA: aldo/keto reductase [Gemmatimonadaceae bacterium]|jgi:aryl-alcohol dehydrogenase-like predicted oxidoreductase|nr:aldo/keto reductase [Gemmatimonadaceae bacterium]